MTLSVPKFDAGREETRRRLKAFAKRKVPRDIQLIQKDLTGIETP